MQAFRFIQPAHFVKVVVFEIRECQKRSRRRLLPSRHTACMFPFYHTTKNEYSTMPGQYGMNG